MLAVAVTVVEPEVTALDLDSEAFRAFYRQALPHVYGYLLHRCGGNVAVAEDLTQETFLAVVADAGRTGRVEPSLPWLYGIARHKLVDHFRRQTRSERLFMGSGDGDLAEVSVDTSGQDARERAVAALAAVIDSQRAVLVLRYLEGFSVPEVAAALDRSVEAVESLLARGRASFKRAYLEAST